MKKTGLLSIVFFSILISKSMAVYSADSINVAPFGKVHIYKQTDSPKNVVIMISGDAGWKFGVVGFAKTFSEMNNLVIGVNVLTYFKDLRQRSEDCYSVAADFVQLATEVEKTYDLPVYKPPIIMGYSSGATLVYGILAQARPGTFVGGISLGFCPDIELPKMLCETNGLSEKVDVTGESYFLEPDAKLGNPWIVLQGELDKVCNYSDAAAFVNKTTDAELIALPKVGHGFSKESDYMPQWKDAFDRLIRKNEENWSVNTTGNQLKDLPVTLTNPKFQDKNLPVVLLFSGDGGWYSFEQSMADKFASLGMPTIGIDSKKYFWQRRTPEGTTSDMVKLLNYYGKEWERDRFLLIGYSLGSEIVPFIVNKFPAEEKSKILSTVLLSPDVTTDFEIHITNMIGIGSKQNTYNVLDEILKMQSVPTLCIFGEEEKSKVPGLLKGTNVKIGILPGDHHYKFNVPLIIKTMEDNKTF